MKRKLHRILSALLAGLLCLALAGCGNVPQTPADDDSSVVEMPNVDNDKASILDSVSEVASETEISSGSSDDVADDHHEAPTGPEHFYSYFYSFSEFSELWEAKKIGDAEVERIGRYLIHTVEEADEFFDAIGSVPIPLLTGGKMRLDSIKCSSDHQHIEIFFKDAKTGDFVSLYTSPGRSLGETLNDGYADAELLETKDCNGYSVRFYKNPNERVTDDIWWTVGFFEAEETAMVITFGRDSTIGKKTDVTLDYLTAPLEYLTVSTIFEQIGE